MTQTAFANKVFHNSDNEVVAYDGSPVSWRISAYSIIINDQQQILIAKTNDELTWDVPGGGVELGETIQEALVREALEEAGAQIEVGSLVTIVEDNFFHRQEQRYFQAVQIFYQAKLIGPLGQPTDPRMAHRAWVDLAKLSDYQIAPAAVEAIKNVREL